MLPNHARNASLRHRLLAMVYEVILLAGVIIITAYLYTYALSHLAPLSNRPIHSAFPTYSTLLQIVIALIIGMYFVGFWLYAGQTLAMKTWHLRIVDTKLRPLLLPRALLRYALAWLWILPPLALCSWCKVSMPMSLLVIMIWIISWASTQWLNRDRQFLHDWLAGTRIISTRR